MKQNISEREIAAQFVNAIDTRGSIVRTITRHSGEIDRKVLPNIVTALGLDNLAARAVADTTSRYNWVAIGTADYTPHINSQEILEAARKAGDVVGSSRELIVMITSWGGAADSITSVQIEMAAIANHQTSGSGHYLNVVNGVSTVLADSDYLQLELQVSVGSHNIAT